MDERTTTRRLRLSLLALWCALGCETGVPAEPGAAAAAPLASGPTSASATENDVGTITIRRLNGVEYDNTVRDLVGTTKRFSLGFPPDDGAEGFTNNAASLNISPLLFEKYEAAADELAALAIANPRIVTCDARASSADACASAVLTRFVHRAWRRTPAPEEVSRLVALVTGAVSQGRSFSEGLALAIRVVLLSPNFLFRIEFDPTPDSPNAHPITDEELASRISYFLWSTTPDDALLAYAAAGKLSTPAVFDTQVRRMLKDPRADALIDEFALGWLVHGLDKVSPDAVTFPEWDEPLRTSMHAETRAFLATFVTQDESFADILDAPFSFLDERLARHYALPGIAGAELRRVTLAESTHRGGLLTQGSVLAMTSVATRTSPVRRGEWVLSELLCSPPPPPPPGVPALPENTSVGTMRTRMAAHRRDPVCATCHVLMDPLGLSLEHYDAIGRWRDEDHGLAIDATGQIPGGPNIDGAGELAMALKSDPRFAACATRKLYAYALGRAPESFDEARLASLARGFAANKYRMRSLIENIVYSDAFRARRGGTP